LAVVIYGGLAGGGVTYDPGYVLHAFSVAVTVTVGTTQRTLA